MRYGVLSFMMSRLDPALAATQHGLIRGLGEMLGQDEGRPVVVLSNPEDIDADSATVLAQLALMRHITLVVICERLGQVPPDILALLRSGRLARIAFHSLDTAQAREFLEVALGGPVSMFAAETLRRLTAGHRDVLHTLVRDCVATGKLQISNGCWVMMPGPLGVGTELGVRAARILQPLAESERSVMEQLALNPTLALTELVRAGFADSVNSLRSAGLVTVGDLPAGQVAMSVPLIGHVLREGIDEDRRSELESMMGRTPAAGNAARTRHDVQEALELGNFEAAIAMVEEYRHLEGDRAQMWGHGIREALQLVEAEVGALCITGDHATAHEVLRQAELGLAGFMPPDPGGDAERARQTLLVLRARVALLMGRHREVPVMLAAAGGPAPQDDAGIWATEGLYFMALACLAESWALTDRQDDALRTVARIRTEISALQCTGILGDIMADAECAEVHGHVLRVLMACGAWSEGTSVARQLLDERCGNAHSMAFTEATLGILGALGGEFDAALGLLTPSLRQLEVWGNPADLGVIDAAAAYCLAEQDQNSEAVKLMVASPPSDGVLLPFTFSGWATETFTSVVLAKLHSPEAALVRLTALADKANESGCRLLEAHSLATALRFGRMELAPRLEAAAGQARGTTAEALRRLATGVIDEDPPAIAAALESLVDLGALMYAEESGNLLFSSLGQKDKRRVTRRLARQRQPEGRGADAGRLGTTEREPKPAWMERLTKREQQVAHRVIEGMSNAAIARLNGVSVRTIEGHLYQVYSKLHVKNREELAELAEAARVEDGRA